VISKYAGVVRRGEESGPGDEEIRLWN